MKYIYDNEGNLITSVFDGTKEEIKKQYENCEFIEDRFLGKQAIINDGKIREITRLDRIKADEEELQDGEYIKDNKIMIINKPNDYYCWDSTQSKWIFDENIKIYELKRKITVEKEKIIENGFEVKINGKKLVQKCREKDKTNILGTIQLMESIKQETIDWKFIDENNNDVMERVTKEQLNNMLVQGAILTSKAIHVEQQLFIKIAALNEIELLNFDVENEFKSLMGG